MTTLEAKGVVDGLVKHCRGIVETAKTANRHRKSLEGHNFYGDRFHKAVVALSAVETKLTPVFTLAGLTNDLTKLEGFLGVMKAPKAALRERHDALKHIKMICEGSIRPALERLSANPTPETEQVLPLDVVRPTGRKYIEAIVIQANGCYEHQWYDACSVMIRRLIETLIIELYEAKGNVARIKNPTSGDFLMLGGLVDSVLADKSWNLARESKKSLPEIKLLGDRSAHTRHYIAKKQDVDKAISGLRVVIEDLLHLAGLL